MVVLGNSTQLTQQTIVKGHFHEVCSWSWKGIEASLIQDGRELLLQVHLSPNVFLLTRPITLIDQIESLKILHRSDSAVHISLASVIGNYAIDINFDTNFDFAIAWKTTFTPKRNMRNLTRMAENFVRISPQKDAGSAKIYLTQTQLRSGLCYFHVKSLPGSLFYFQNLTSLNEFAEDTRSTLADTVRIDFPDFGFYLPAEFEGMLEAGKPYVLTHAQLYYSSISLKDDLTISEQYDRFVYAAYQQLDKPPIRLAPIHRYAERVLDDLASTFGCWQQIADHPYLNAYINDYKTPAESMVQAAVLSALFQYGNKFNKTKAKQLCQVLLEGIGAFYDEKIKSIGRWIPDKAHHLDHSEEQKKARIMDSWYLHHPLLHLISVLKDYPFSGRLKQQVEDSLDYCIKVAHHFDYRWPIFYDIDTLAVVKREAQPGDAGQKDVGGLYALLMLQAYQLFGKINFLKEAKRAGKTLFDYGLELLYQSNNTAYTAEALASLWSVSKEEKYLSYSYLCLSNLLRNTSLWNRLYGNAKEYPSFFSLYPLKDAPYAAVFEEQECIASIYRYLRLLQQEGATMPAELESMACEYVKYGSARIPYYSPALLPVDILAKEPKTGYLLADSWIPLEDLGDGWDPVGQVGQEVYGAGALFQLAHLQLIPLAEDQFCHLDYPYVLVSNGDKRTVLHVFGDKQYSFNLQLVGRRSHQYSISLENGEQVVLDRYNKTYEFAGGQRITINRI